jgi:hypothetical protein
MHLQQQQPKRQELAMYYGGITVTRVVVYLLHRQGYFWYLTKMGSVSAVPVDLMSDHVFLGSSMVAILQSELVWITHVVRSCRQADKRYRQAATGLLMFCLFLLAITCLDMYFTAKYFHRPLHTLWAALLGLVAFQIPVAFWLVKAKLQFTLQ